MDPLQEYSTALSGIANAYRKSQTLFTAVELDVFSLLTPAAPAEHVAEKTGCSLRGVRMLLDALVAMELLWKGEGRYGNTPMAEACLVEGAPAWQGDIIRHAAANWDAWGGLAECVRTGTCAPPANERERSGPALRNFILGMDNIARFSAQGVLGAVDLSGRRRMLDLAGGPATYSIAFLREHPALRATLFDRPAVIEIAKEQVGTAGLADRFDYRAGDCLADPLGGPYDLVFMSNIIHSFSADENRALVARAFQSLEPGGLIIIKDFLTDDDRTGPPYSLTFALIMLVNTPAGGTYSVSEAAEWTGAAGFLPGRMIPLTAQSRLWVAEKPED